jgi:hypothetical protein
MRAISKSERYWVLGFGAIMMLITSLPYILGYANQTESWQFSGFVISIEDGNAFIAKMLTGTMGNWLFRTPYTAYPQRGFLIFLPYILLGKLVSSPGTHEQLVAIYHLFRFASGILAIAATYDFLSFFVESPRYRRLGLVLATLGGGLGWLLVALNMRNWMGFLPLDFYSPESFGFLGLLIYPHYSLARALLLWGSISFLKAVLQIENGAPILKEGWKPGLLWLLTAIVQPLTGMVAGAIVGIYLFSLLIWQLWRWVRKQPVQWQRWGIQTRLAVWAGLFPAPFILYNLISQHVDPFLKVWTDQSYFGSPHPVHYLLAYGLVLPFAILGAKKLLQDHEWIARFPVYWAIFLPVLAYAPVSIQRRLPEGIWVAIVVLTVLGLESLQNTRFRRAGWALGLTFLTTLMLFLGSFLAILQPVEPIFRPTDEIAAFNFISEKASEGDVVLLSYESGNPLLAYAPVRVIVGHGPESVGFNDLLPRIQAFYNPETSDVDRIALLQEQQVVYVFWGPNERLYGDWNPALADYLIPVYEEGEYAVFQVVLPE